MKHILIIILLLSIVESAVCGGGNPEPDKRLYKLEWGIMPPGNCWIGGGWSEYEPERSGMSFEEKRKLIEFENMTQAAEKGREFISWGISALVLGTMLVFFLKQYQLQWIGIGVCGFGLWSFSKGILEIKIAENWQVVTGASAVAIVLAIVAAMLWPRGVDIGEITRNQIARIKTRRKRNPRK